MTHTAGLKSSPYRIPLLDLTRHHALIAADVERVWRETLTAMRLLGGDQVHAFEQEIAAYAGVAHACGVSSGTDALLLGLIASGVGRGDGGGGFEGTGARRSCDRRGAWHCACRGSTSSRRYDDGEEPRDAGRHRPRSPGRATGSAR